MDNNSQPVQILGPNGQPVSLSKEQRTEDLLGSYDSYLSQSFALPPFNPDLLIASKGYKALEAQLHMTAARAPLNIIRSATLYKGIEIQASVLDETDERHAKAQELAQAFQFAIENIEDEAGNVQDFRHVIYELLGAVHYGFNVTEIGWRYLDKGAYAGKLGFSGFASKPCKQIGFSVDPQTLAVQGITSYTPLTGYRFNLPVEKVLRYTFQPQDSLPYGNGIGRVIYKHTWSMDFLMKFWNLALETFGSPFIKATAPPQQLKLAQAAIAQIRQGAPAVFPTGVVADLVQVATGGLSSFRDALQYHGDQCALAYLNNTLTSNASGGTNTNALGQVHQDTQEYGLGYIRRDVENVINNQLVRRWVRYNYGDDFLEIAPQVSLGQWDAVDMNQMAGAFGKLIKSNVIHEQEPFIRKHLNLPPPSPDTQEKLDERRQPAAQAASTDQKSTDDKADDSSADDSKEKDDAS